MKKQTNNGALSSRAKAARTVKSSVVGSSKKRVVIERATSRVRLKTRMDGAFRD